MMNFRKGKAHRCANISRPCYATRLASAFSYRCKLTSCISTSLVLCRSIGLERFDMHDLEELLRRLQALADNPHGVTVVLLAFTTLILAMAVFWSLL
jgi:hypothetical protein